MQRDKAIEQDFNENKTRIRLSRISMDATKKKPLQFKTPRIYSLEDPSIEQSRVERKLQQSLDSISTIANRNTVTLPRKLTLVAQEKVEDYRKLMSNPVTIGDKKYKYSPADSVTLETYAPIEPEYNDDDIRRLNGFKNISI